jgi:hypothetical protein
MLRILSDYSEANALIMTKSEVSLATFYTWVVLAYCNRSLIVHVAYQR